MTARWFVVQCKSGQDERAERELWNQHFETFFPKAKAEVLKRGKPEEIKRYLLRGWGFVRFDIVGDHWVPILSTRGVHRLLGTLTSDGMPAPVPDWEIAELRAIVEAHGNAVPVHFEKLPPLSPGTMIRLLIAPYEGREAEVTLDGKSKVAVLLRRAGALSKVIVPRDRIALLDTAGQLTRRAVAS